MRNFTQLEKQILNAASANMEIMPPSGNLFTACEAMAKEGLLEELRYGVFCNTAKGEQAYWHSIGKGAEYDRMAA